MKPAAGMHPRLLFSSDELPALRASARHGLKGEMLRRLAAVCRNCMTPGHPDYLDFRERQRDIWRLRSGIFTVLPSLQSMAAAYAFTGEPACGDFARDAAMAIIEHGLADVRSLTYGSTSEGWRRGPGHDKGKFAQTLAWVYDTCFDRFSAAQRTRFADYALECVRLADEHRTFDLAQIANNRGVAGRMVPILLGLALEGDTALPDFEAWMADAIVNLEKYLFLGFDADGAPYEGPGYAGRIEMVAWVAEAIRRRGGPNLLTNVRFERFLQYLLYELVPGGGSANNLNDTRIPCGSVAGCLHLLGTERGALLPWLTRQLDLHPLRTRSWLEPEAASIRLDDLPNLVPFLLHWREDVPIRRPEELGYPASRGFRTRGVASMRTGWDEPDALVTHFCGRQELYCHRQGDFNHVSLYALGESFLVDAGYGYPFGDMSQPVDRWFGLTSSHNCVLIDGMNQRGVVGAPGWAEGEMLEFVSSPGFATSLGDASSCTGPDHRVRRSLRRVVLVHTGPALWIAVLDLVERDGQPFHAEGLWTTAPGNRTTVEGHRFVIHGRSNRCEAEVLWPPQAAVHLADSFGRPQVRVSVSAAVAEIVTVFAPCSANAPSPRWSCSRDTEGQFHVTWHGVGQTVELCLSAATFGPLRRPVPVRMEEKACP